MLTADEFGNTEKCFIFFLMSSWDIILTTLNTISDKAEVEFQVTVPPNWSNDNDYNANNMIIMYKTMLSCISLYIATLP